MATPEVAPTAHARPDPAPDAPVLPLRLAERFLEVRSQTEALAAGLSAEDQVVQSMPDVSPTKWHRAHTTWFFETFVLSTVEGYEPYDPAYAFLFNSYYEAVGPRHARDHRGHITRPGIEEIARYRRHVDEAMSHALPGLTAQALGLVELGLHHEQQHQELLLMDIQHVLSCNPTHPAYTAAPAAQERVMPDKTWFYDPGGLTEIGHGGAGFAFDNEGPRHRVHLEPFEVRMSPVTCGEWLEFMASGGYSRADLWLSDGWATVRQQQWQAPLYWQQIDGEWMQFTLHGLLPLDLDAPVCHISYYEADAYAHWAGHRLPTEAEWETALSSAWESSRADFDQHQLRPRALEGAAIGQVWEWTSSSYSAYPRFKPAGGAVGEYNGKFMSGQQVLRGGAVVTPQDHARPTYRNFFPPAARWAFSGLRLARDVAPSRFDAPVATRSRVIVDVHVGPDDWRSALRADAEAGLTITPKTMPPTWFYDDYGSQLFDEITRLPEYYLTRAERSILERRAAEIVELAGADTIVELGSGTSEKTRLLLDAAYSRGGLQSFVPFDVSEGVLRAAAATLSERYDGVAVHAVVGDFHRHLAAIPSAGRRLFLFLGSTIGNLDVRERRRFLSSLASTMAPGDSLLLGTDLRKDPARLIAAYDDAQGISAEFNRNLLRVLNTALDADFDVEAFRHVARWNSSDGQMEMRLVPDAAQSIHVAALGLDVHFAAGEEMLTEISAKFTSAQVEAELDLAGLALQRIWTDEAGDFQLSLARLP